MSSADTSARARSRARTDEPPEWSRPRVQLTVRNLVAKTGTTAGVDRARRINPNWNFQSLEQLVEHGRSHGTVMIFQIVSIKSNRSETNTRISQRNRGGSGGRTHDSSTVRYKRSITLMCLLSDSKANIAMMFQGMGNNDNLFNCDLSERFNGGLRESRHWCCTSIDSTPPHASFVSRHWRFRGFDKRRVGGDVPRVGEHSSHPDRAQLHRRLRQFPFARASAPDTRNGNEWGSDERREGPPTPTRCL